MQSEMELRRTHRICDSRGLPSGAADRKFAISDILWSEIRSNFNLCFWKLIWSGAQTAVEVFLFFLFLLLNDEAWLSSHTSYTD